MHKQKPHVEILSKDGTGLELRFWDRSQGPGYLSWHLEQKVAKALVEWWTEAGHMLKTGDLPINGCRYGSLIISMTVLSTVAIRTLNCHGKVQPLGCELPRDVIESLVYWLENGELITVG